MSKTIVMITVDTEFSTHKDDIGVSGRVNGQYYGVPKLMQILNKYRAKATFFVDVYTNKTKYIPALRDICLELKRQGHDLQLHTHPNGLFDPKRGGMKDYSLSEQIEIIKKGKDIFTEWFGEPPSAHRAGDWGANYETLKALNENGIFVDSSMFYGWDNCQLNTPPLSKNRVVNYHQLLELPATVFECEGLGVFSPYRLLSTDGNSLGETLGVINSLHKKGVPLINMVYHSFSFVKWNKERTEYKVDQNRIKKFERFLEVLTARPEFEIKTVREASDLYRQDRSRFEMKEDVLPKTGLTDSLLRLVDRFQS